MKTGHSLYEGKLKRSIAILRDLEKDGKLNEETKARVDEVIGILEQGYDEVQRSSRDAAGRIVWNVLWRASLAYLLGESNCD